MHQASAPVFVRGLQNLQAVLRKGQAHAEQIGSKPDALLHQRLVFDMFPLRQQVQRACDTAARSMARLAQVEPKPFPDEEQTLDELCARIERTIEYVQSFQPGQINGCEERSAPLKIGKRQIDFTGQELLLSYALPNFYFHCTTAYDILRASGVQVGKRDFLGVI